MNRFEIERGTANVSSSAKKLQSERINIVTDSTIGYRFINFLSIFLPLCEYLCCKECGSKITFGETSKRGLGFKLVIICKMCGEKYIDSCPLISNAYEVNRRFIFAMRIVGIGLNGAEKFCGLMDLPRPIFQSFYDRVVSNICCAARFVCDASLIKSGQEEKLATAKETGECAGLTISGDGSWKKRGFNSLYGVSSLIGYYTNRVVDIIVKSSYCKACSVWETRKETGEYQDWLKTHNPTCVANREGSAGKMEVDGIQEMFERSEDFHDVQYINYIGDGNTRTYKAIVETMTHEVTKKECINHIQKRMGARLRQCKKDNKGLGGKGKLTGKLMDELSNYYGLAIRRNVNSVENMYKEIWATLYDTSSSDESPQHHFCPEGVNSWCLWQKAKAAGALDTYKHKTPLSLEVIKGSP